MAIAVQAKAIDDGGSIFYEADLHSMKDTDKHWWPQPEAIIGFGTLGK